MIDRYRAAVLLTERLTDELVIGGLANPSFELFRAGDRDRNFYMWGAMGLASSIGLGVALASPGSRVIVLDGDGSVLMNLGTLATIGRYNPPNLVHIILDNARYEVTGGQETHTAHGTNLADVARACGIVGTRVIRSEQEYAVTLDEALRSPGPWTIVVECPAEVSDSPERQDAVRRLRDRFLNTQAFIEHARRGRGTEVR